MSFETYQNKGLTGLANLGNTCFINACIQILSHTYELNQFLDNKTYQKKIKNNYESVLLVEWDNLRTLMWSENCIVSPGKFIKTIQKISQVKNMELFTGYSQNDLPEFLLFIIDCFHTSLSREVNMTINGNAANETDQMAIKCFEMIKKMYAKEYSEIWNLFYGIHVSQIISIETGKVLSSSPEPYFMINLSLPSDNRSPSLIDCLDLYVNGEILEGENAWYNEETKEKQNVQKKIMYWSMPTILAIDIKRFNHRNQKNQVLVTFPLTDLDLSNYIVGYKKESYIYDLYGICNHSGSVEGGHYTAFVKNANDKWYHFNDTHVKEIDDLSELVTPKAYCLFYRKKTMQ
uniref:USP domain-containing protein n=1 Tax=viral metagenome TaxID=1070528 RepID=A0A6C0B0A7_9ZZZZ